MKSWRKRSLAAVLGWIVGEEVAALNPFPTPSLCTTSKISASILTGESLPVPDQ